MELNHGKTSSWSVMPNFYMHGKIKINTHTHTCNNSTKSGRNRPKAKHTKLAEYQIFSFTFPIIVM